MLLEALFPGPSHVLEDDASALSNQDEVTEAMHNYRALALFDDIWEDCECRRETGISLGENIISAHHPVNVRCVNCRLDIRAIEVHRSDLSHEKTTLGIQGRPTVLATCQRYDRCRKLGSQAAPH